MSGKTAVQPKRDEQGLIDRVPMRESPLVVSHPNDGVWTRENFSQILQAKPPEKAAAARIGRPTVCNTVIGCSRAAHDLPGPATT
jgi:hypothetical protein